MHFYYSYEQALKQTLKLKMTTTTTTTQELTTTLGKVYIASKDLYGQRAIVPTKTIIIDVTSAQQKKNVNRLTFSPMTPIEGKYKGYWNFEAFWQSGKVFEGIPENDVKRFWKNVEKPTRRYPKSKRKGKALKVLYTRFENSEEKMDYVTARKKVYVPCYFDLIKEKEQTIYLKQLVMQGLDVVIYDFDGPRTQDGEVMCLEINEELLNEKINDVRHPFGHGYIVGAWLKNIHPEKYAPP